MTAIVCFLGSNTGLNLREIAEDLFTSGVQISTLQ